MQTLKGKGGHGRCSLVHEASYPVAGESYQEDILIRDN